jgi:hypothetical protein
VSILCKSRVLLVSAVRVKETEYLISNDAQDDQGSTWPWNTGRTGGRPHVCHVVGVAEGLCDPAKLAIVEMQHAQHMQDFMALIC